MLHFISYSCYKILKSIIYTTDKYYSLHRYCSYDYIILYHIISYYMILWYSFAVFSRCKLGQLLFSASLPDWRAAASSAVGSRWGGPRPRREPVASGQNHLVRWIWAEICWRYLVRYEYLSTSCESCDVITVHNTITYYWLVFWPSDSLRMIGSDSCMLIIVVGHLKTKKAKKKKKKRELVHCPLHLT